MTLEIWLEMDWDAPRAGADALAAFLRTARAGDPVELAVTAGELSEEEAGGRLLDLLHGEPQLAERLPSLPEIVVYAGGVPADVPAGRRLPGPGVDLRALRERWAPYVALTPVLNQADWARTWEPEPGFHHLVVDNASDDGTAEILAERGADVVACDERVGRVENWQRALEVFRERSGATWVKWAFAGDRLLPGAAGVLDRATAAHPEARLISAEYDWRHRDGNVSRFRTVERHHLAEPKESMYRFALQGNWLGGPVAVALHRDVLGDFEFGRHPWVADWQASQDIALRHPVLYWCEPIGFFDASRGRYHLEHEQDVATAIQDAAMRYQALGRLREIAPAVDTTDVERQLDELVLRLCANRAEIAVHAASAPPATRVGVEPGPAGVTRVRVGGRQKGRGKSGKRRAAR